MITYSPATRDSGPAAEIQMAEVQTTRNSFKRGYSYGSHVNVRCHLVQIYLQFRRMSEQRIVVLQNSYNRTEFQSR